MTTNNAHSPAFGRKLLAGLVALGLAAMFFSSIVYRMQNPSRVIRSAAAPVDDHGDEGRPPMGQAPGQGGQGGPMGGGMPGMGDIGGLMAKMQEDPQNLEVLTTLARKFLEMGDPSRAEFFVKRAQTVAPTDQQVQRLLGMIYFQTDRHAEAAKIFEDVVKADPTDAGAHYNLGILYKHYMNRTADAEREFKSALDHVGADKELEGHIRQELVPGS